MDFIVFSMFFCGFSVAGSQLRLKLRYMRLKMRYIGLKMRYMRPMLRHTRPMLRHMRAMLRYIWAMLRYMRPGKRYIGRSGLTGTRRPHFSARYKDCLSTNRLD